MKDYVLRNRKGLLLVLLAVLVTSLVEISNIKESNKPDLSIRYNGFNIEQKQEFSEEKIVEQFFTDNQNYFAFYAKTFQIEEEKLIALLKDDYQNNGILEATNLDKYLIDYLLALESENKDLFNNKITSSMPNSEYIVSLIKYFTKVYDNVDFKIAAAIGLIESGYRSEYMLKCNNVFGGMAGGKLIKYKNIEYGILKYVQLLSEGYFAKGLDTVEKIGRVYNPVVNANGQKVASPTWIVNVNNAISKYEGITLPSTLAEILTLQTKPE